MAETSLRAVPFFASLPPQELQRLATSLQQVAVPAGTLLLQEGERGDAFYLVLAGELDIVKALGTGDERVLRVAGPGAVVGEMSLLNRDGRRTASARARTPVRTMVMTRAELDVLLQRHPAVAYDLARSLSMRLQAADNATIRDLHLKNQELHAAYAELQRAQAVLIEKEAWERELQVARAIQMSMVPRGMPQVPGYDLGAQLVPAHAVGGDFFDFVPLDADRLGIVIGDVSGKGVPAALFMALTGSLWRVEASHTVTPHATLQRLNQYLLERNDTTMFVTVLYGVLDQRSGTFAYARGGHDLPLMIAADGTVETPPMGLGQPLGVLPEPVLDAHVVTVPPGGMLLLYTDGVTEAMDMGRTLFGLERLQAVVRGQGGLAPERLCERVWQALTAFRGEAPQADDVTMVAVRARGQRRLTG